MSTIGLFADDVDVVEMKDDAIEITKKNGDIIGVMRSTDNESKLKSFKAKKK